MKARLFLYGNQDEAKDGSRKDSFTAQFGVIRLIESFAARFILSLVSIEIQKAYAQSGAFKIILLLAH